MEGAYTLEEFKELSGEAWVKLISTLQVEFDKVMEVLEQNVVFVDEVEEVYTDDDLFVDAEDEPEFYD